LLKAVDGVCYYVDKGEIVGLVGESGSITTQRCKPSCMGSSSRRKMRRPSTHISLTEGVSMASSNGKTKGVPEAVLDVGYHSKENLTTAEKLRVDYHETSNKWEQEAQGEIGCAVKRLELIWLVPP